MAVMAEGAFSFKKLLDQCENQELEVTIRVALGEAAGSPQDPGGAGLQGNRARGLRIGGGAGGGRLEGAGAGPVESGALTCSDGQGFRPSRPNSLGAFCCLSLANEPENLAHLCSLHPPLCCSG